LERIRPTTFRYKSGDSPQSLNSWLLCRVLLIHQWINQLWLGEWAGRPCKLSCMFCSLQSLILTRWSPKCTCLSKHMFSKLRGEEYRLWNQTDWVCIWLSPF
jgi:hypothetical protein